jgi:hypothetical protein
MNQPVFFNILLIVTTLALAVAFVIYQIHQAEWLKRYGRPVVATITSIRHETGKTPTGFSRDNYYLTAKWTNPRTGKTYTFWTWIMSRCPEIEQGSLVSILIDPKNPHRYTMEL